MRLYIKKVTWSNTLKLGYGVIGVIALFVASYIIFNNLHRAAADTINWTSQPPAYTIDTTRSTDTNNISYNGGVTPVTESVYLGKNTSPTTLAVYNGQNYRIALYNGSIYIGTINDPNMYLLNGFGAANTYNWLVSPSTDNFVLGGGYEISHINTRLVASTLNGVPVYNLDSPADDPALHFFQYNNGDAIAFGNMDISQNGEWAIARISSPIREFVRINLNDYSTKLFAPETANYGYGFNPDYTGGLTISNDGRFATIAGLNVGIAVYDLEGTSCGASSTPADSAWKDSSFTYATCPSQDFTYAATSAAGITGNSYPSYAQFLDDSGGQLEFMVIPLGSSQPPKWVIATAANYTVPPTLDYLALGDSYSSGEGDFSTSSTGQNYYLAGTNIDGDGTTIATEKCHVSTESYPFLLASAEHLSANQMHSVACSGAETSDIQGSSKNTAQYGDYYGQPNSSLFGNQDLAPRLKSVNGLDTGTMQTQALDDFTPGRIQQVKFVKQYKPKAITLTIGGNDVDFKGMLEMCVIPNACLGDNLVGKQILAQLLKSEYTRLVQTYTALKNASPTTKIYVVGYPQFVSTGNLTCPTNVLLNTDARSMMQQAVTYFDQIIKAAAAASGAYYVDIENSLGDHTLCGASTDSYVNGFSVALSSLKDGPAGAFHPNAQGHAAIAQTIVNGLNGATLETFNDCTSTVIICPQNSSSTIPDPNIYFDLPTTVTNIATNVGEFYNFLTGPDSTPKQGSAQTVTSTSLPMTLQPNSTVQVIIHSDPITLGTVTTDSSGNFSTGVTIPSDLPAGFHTLEVTGTTATGEPISYYQTFYVAGPNSNDVNGDGIDDSTESCIYVPDSGIDANMNGIDDACDPNVGTAPQLYRVVEGDATKTYNGAPENSGYLYVERNTRASSLTGVSGDYEPNGNGWAIVGASQGLPYSLTSIPDTAPAANFEVVGSGTSAIPYVYIRAGGYGCVSYTPTSLAQVQQGQYRTLTMVTQDTNKCRQQDPSADVDGDGQPDNTQPLYSARLGDPTITDTEPDGTTVTEDPNKVYLFRNFYSAEAQLGISDFSPTGTAYGSSDQPIQAWNLLASSQDESMSGYSKLVMVNDANGSPTIPTILTKDQAGNCTAYQPASLAVIDPATQYTRGFTQLATLPTGVSCN